MVISLDNMDIDINILKQADIFHKLTPTQLALVANIGQIQTFNAGENIFFEGTDSDELYIIIQGQIDILVNPISLNPEPGDGQQPIIIATLRQGQSFGEIALVDKGLRSATARASQDNSQLFVIQSQKLMLLCDSYPNLGYRLMYNFAADLALKIRSMDLRIREELLYAQGRQ